MSLRVGSVTPRFFGIATVSPSPVSANSQLTETYTVNGLQTDMMIVVNQEQANIQAGLALVSPLVSAANTLKLTWINSTSSPITPTASQTIKVVGM